MGVDPSLVDLGAGVGVPITVACDLPGLSNIVVAKGLPPDAGFSLLHPLKTFINAFHVPFYAAAHSCHGASTPLGRADRA
jgi:hypothetical protein